MTNTKVMNFKVTDNKVYLTMLKFSASIVLILLFPWSCIFQVYPTNCGSKKLLFVVIKISEMLANIFNAKR